MSSLEEDTKKRITEHVAKLHKNFEGYREVVHELMEAAVILEDRSRKLKHISITALNRLKKRHGDDAKDLWERLEKIEEEQRGVG